MVMMMQLCQTSDLTEGAKARPSHFGECLNISLSSWLFFTSSTHTYCSEDKQTGGEEVRKGIKDLPTEKWCGRYSGYFVFVCPCWTMF